MTVIKSWEVDKVCVSTGLSVSQFAYLSVLKLTQVISVYLFTDEVDKDRPS